MSHTEGKLTIDGFGNIRVEGGGFLRLYGSTLCHREEAEANTRRLVACWNACHDMPTEDVEELVSIDHGVMRLVVLADDLRKERDELLKALANLYNEGDDSGVTELLSRYQEEE